MAVTPHELTPNSHWMSSFLVPTDISSAVEGSQAVSTGTGKHFLTCAHLRGSKMAPVTKIWSILNFGGSPLWPNVSESRSALGTVVTLVLDHILDQIIVKDEEAVLHRRHIKSDWANPLILTMQSKLFFFSSDLRSNTEMGEWHVTSSIMQPVSDCRKKFYA
jgi:hypothetical protein